MECCAMSRSKHKYYLDGNRLSYEGGKSLSSSVGLALLLLACAGADLDPVCSFISITLGCKHVI